MAKLKFFDGINTLEDLETEYRRLAMQLHPDRGGTDREFQDLNDEYTRMRIALDLLPEIRPSVEINAPKAKPKPRKAKKFSSVRREAITQNAGEIARNLVEEGVEMLFSRFS